MRILVTGGAGYIGSHTCVELIESGHDVTILDSFRNSREDVMDSIKELARDEPRLIVGDVRNLDTIIDALRESQAEAVIHFAALKAVGESWQIPLEYFENNIGGTLNLLRAMDAAEVDKLVFSSSATVYGDAASQPIRESSPLSSTNPYARTKVVAEQLISDFVASTQNFSAAILRYFNPAGAHVSGKIGEYPLGTPNNLVPYVAQTAAGLHPFVGIFGSDYPTPDGTGVRDYIHVTDLAIAHVKALDYLATNHTSLTVNLGTGRGHSVLEVIRAFEEVSGRSIPVQPLPRRQGDVAVSFADPSLANQLLQWHAQHDLRRMCEDAWRWQDSLRT